MDFSKAETVTGKCDLSALAKHGYFFHDQANYRDPFNCPEEGQIMSHSRTRNEFPGKLCQILRGVVQFILLPVATQGFKESNNLKS